MDNSGEVLVGKEVKIAEKYEVIKREAEQFAAEIEELENKSREIPGVSEVSRFLFEDTIVRRNERGVVVEQDQKLISDVKKLIGEMPLDEGESYEGIVSGDERIGGLVKRVGEENIRAEREINQTIDTKIREWLSEDRWQGFGEVVDEVKKGINYEKTILNPDEDREKSFEMVIQNIDTLTDLKYKGKSAYSDWLIYHGKINNLGSLVIDRFTESDDWVEVEIEDGWEESTARELRETREVLKQVEEYFRLARTYKDDDKIDQDLLKMYYSDGRHIFERASFDYLSGADYADNPWLIKGVQAAGRKLVNVDELRQKGAIERKGREYEAESVMRHELGFGVVGLEAEEDEVLFIDQEKIVNLLVNRRSYGRLFPSFFLEGIGAMKFEKSDSVRKAEESIKAENMVLSSWWMENKLERVIVHEIFEHAKNRLSLEEMQAWDKAMKDDANHGGVEVVTDYGVWAKERGGGYKWEKEDFCDAGAMFWNEPERLASIAPSRFEFMLNYYSSHLPRFDDNGVEVRVNFVKEIRDRVEFYLKLRGQKESVVWREHLQEEVKADIEEDAKAAREGKESRYHTAGEYLGEGDVIMIYTIYKLPKTNVKQGI